MNHLPNHKQMRGYIFLTVLLLVASIVLFVVVKKSDKDSHSVEVQLYNQSMERYGDSLTAEKPARHYTASSRKYEDKQPSFAYTVQDSLAWTQSRPQPLHFELNTADTTDLQQLYGIGPTLARRIVKYRERLGGYINLQQLREVYGITPEWYEKIAAQLSVDPSLVQPININTITLEQLRRHPYLDYYQAKAIINYRNTGVTYHNIHDLSVVNLMDDTTLRKMAPYIVYQ